MILREIKSFLKVLKIVCAPNFWFPYPTIFFTRPIFAINKAWSFRMALNIQVALFRKKLRLRKLGHFYEFGSFKGDSLILFGIIKKFLSIFNPELKKQKIFSFDSFQGLPKNNLDHKDPVWREKEFCGTLKEVINNVSSYGISFEYIKGFYSDSLTSNLKERMLKNPPSIIHIDVDLYSSTKEVLEWLDKISLPMAIYIFDDIWALGNHPYLGEQRAIKEYNQIPNNRGFLVESPLSMGSKTIYSFTLREPLNDSFYSSNYN